MTSDTTCYPSPWWIFTKNSHETTRRVGGELLAVPNQWFVRDTAKNNALTPSIHLNRNGF